MVPVVRSMLPGEVAKAKSKPCADEVVAVDVDEELVVEGVLVVVDELVGVDDVDVLEAVVGLVDVVEVVVEGVVVELVVELVVV